MKKFFAIFLLISLIISTPLAGAETPTIPAQSTVINVAGDATIAQSEISIALGKLIQIYEKRISGMQEENNRLRSENDALRAQLGKVNSGAVAAIPTTPSTPAGTGSITVVPTPPVAKTDTDKKHDLVVAYVTTNLADLLKKNNITASGSIGLFEFIEPKNFFISIDDGKNPIGVTAFKTKVLFEYDSNLNLKVLGVFNLDYDSGKYITIFGTNPFARVVRIRVKNPNYIGKLLEEAVVVPSTGTVLSSGPTITGSTIIPAPSVTGGGSTVSTSITLETIRKAYEKNKLGDVVQMSTTYLQTTPNDVEVLTMRARSQYIFSKFNEALNDIESIYKIQ